MFCSFPPDFWISEMRLCSQMLKLKEDGSKHSVKVDFFWYGTTSNRDKSGAYLFLPDGEAKVKHLFHYMVQYDL